MSKRKQKPQQALNLYFRSPEEKQLFLKDWQRLQTLEQRYKDHVISKSDVLIRGLAHSLSFYGQDVSSEWMVLAKKNKKSE